MTADGWVKSVAAVKAELKRLEEALQRADARGDRPAALRILSSMLDLQKQFMQWSQDRRQGSNGDGEMGITPTPVRDVDRHR